MLTMKFSENSNGFGSAISKNLRGYNFWNDLEKLRSVKNYFSEKIFGKSIYRDKINGIFKIVKIDKIWYRGVICDGVSESVIRFRVTCPPE